MTHRQVRRKGIKHDKCIFFCHSMFTVCDIIKNWVAPASQRRATQCQFDNFVEFIAKTEEFVVFM